jgi:hypothetical protein
MPHHAANQHRKDCTPLGQDVCRLGSLSSRAKWPTRQKVETAPYLSLVIRMQEIFDNRVSSDWFD